MTSKYKQRLASITTIQYIKNKNNQTKLTINWLKPLFQLRIHIHIKTPKTRKLWNYLGNTFISFLEQIRKESLQDWIYRNCRKRKLMKEEDKRWRGITRILGSPSHISQVKKEKLPKQPRETIIEEQMSNNKRDQLIESEQVRTLKKKGIRGFAGWRTSKVFLMGL